MPAKARWGSISDAASSSPQTPATATAAISSIAVFDIETAGARSFNGSSATAIPRPPAPPQRRWVDIPGATAPSYTTPDRRSRVRTRFRAVASSGCTERTSAPAVLQVADAMPPQGAVLSPSGGEVSSLSDPPPAAPAPVIAWTMADDVRICQVRVSLLGSPDDETWQPLDSTPGLPAVSREPGAALLPRAKEGPDSPTSCRAISRTSAAAAGSTR